MKTLKQIREEYEDHFVSQVDAEVMLEDTFKPKDVIPSSREMPSLLVFRRVSFRSYPKGQVVALYYSKTLNKYLSIPFGPGGNLNLSESSVYDTLEELDLAEGAKWDAVKGGLKGAAAGAVKGFAVGTAVGHLPGATAGTVVGAAHGAYKGAKSAYNKSKAQEVDEGMIGDVVRGYVTGGVRGAVTAFGKNVIGGSGSKKDDDEKGDDEQEKTTKLHNEPFQKTKGLAKIKSSWKSKSDESPIDKTRMKQSALAPIKENKISDIRSMVESNGSIHEMTINGKTVTLNTSMAKRILEVYDSVNTKNKKIVEGMLNEDLESFKKLLNFSIRN
jgi:hypothetical protein